MGKTAALVMRDVSLNFGPVLALDHFSLTVDAGMMVALVGPNGSGKSSALAVAAGILDPASGIVAVAGLQRRDNPQEYALRVGYVPQEPALYDELTPLQNLRFFGQLFSIEAGELNDQIEFVLTRFRLRDFAKRPVSSLSGGMKQRVNIACAMLHQPLLLILDEPTAALDSRSRDELLDALQSIRDTGTAILFSSHIDQDLYACDEVVQMESEPAYTEVYA